MGKCPKYHNVIQTRKETPMKQVLSLLAAVTLIFSMAVTPVCAGGDKVQNEHGAATAPGFGDDAQDHQVSGD